MYGKFLPLPLHQPRQNTIKLIWVSPKQIWDVFEGEPLFSGYDQRENAYRSRAHLAEMISLLGLPPSTLLTRGTW